MYIHRVRKAQTIDKNPSPTLFVEMTPDSWVEVSELPDHKEIHRYNEIKKRNHTGVMEYATRAFNIGIIKDWEEINPITSQ